MTSYYPKHALNTISKESFYITQQYHFALLLYYPGYRVFDIWSVALPTEVQGIFIKDYVHLGLIAFTYEIHSVAENGARNYALSDLAHLLI